MSAGRPTEYKPEYCNQAEVYLMNCEDTLTERGKIQVKLPTTDGFARFLGVARSSLYLWEKSHPGFSDALDKIRNEQQERLINMGLSGDYNSTIAKLVLSSNHGMKEKSETDVTSGGEKVTFGWNVHNNPLHTETLGD